MPSVPFVFSLSGQFFGVEEHIGPVVKQAIADKVSEWNRIPPFHHTEFIWHGETVVGYYASPEEMVDSIVQDVGVIGLGILINLYTDVINTLDGLPNGIRQQGAGVRLDLFPDGQGGKVKLNFDTGFTNAQIS